MCYTCTVTVCLTITQMISLWHDWHKKDSIKNPQMFCIFTWLPTYGLAAVRTTLPVSSLSASATHPSDSSVTAGNASVVSHTSLRQQRDSVTPRSWAAAAWRLVTPRPWDNGRGRQWQTPATPKWLLKPGPRHSPNHSHHSPARVPPSRRQLPGLSKYWLRASLGHHRV